MVGAVLGSQVGKGSGRTAAQIATRYRKDPSVRRLCQTVVPVAGAGFAVDYAVVRSPGLAEPAPGGPWVVLAAARLGATRLIDNLEFRVP